MVDFWQARPPQWQPHHCCATAATAAFYFEKSRQDHGLAGTLMPTLQIMTFMIYKFFDYYGFRTEKILIVQGLNNHIYQNLQRDILNTHENGSVQ